MKMLLCGHRANSMEVTPSSCYEREVFPAYWIARLFGFHRTHRIDADEKINRLQRLKILLNCILLFFRRFGFLIYLGTCLLWVIIFSICVFSYEMLLFERGKANGTERESNIIIRLLDNVPWTAVMLRNILVICIFYRRYAHFVELTHTLSHMLQKFDSSPRPLVPLIQYAKKTIYVGLLIVVVNFLMSLMSYFNANFSEVFGKWVFYPFPMTLIAWQVALCLCVFTLAPFLMAQVILGSVIGLAAGGLRLVRHLNKTLVHLSQSSEYCYDSGGTPTRSFSVDDGVNFAEYHQKLKTARYEELCAIRLTHFQIAHYLHTINETFSELLLVVIGADFAAAVGNVGLLIGRPPSSNIVSFYFAPIYNAVATVTWMGFFLCAQYWPLIRLPEEAEKTYHHIQRLSIYCWTSRTEKWERELLHFLLATKETHVGIVAGKLLFFSRHLSVTMITLLCSYGVLVYELLHRDRGGGPEHIPEMLEGAATSLLAKAAANSSDLSPAPPNQKLLAAIDFYQNMSLGAHH